jgi:polyphosphate kinase
MTRNLDYRVEAVTPVTDVSLRRQLRFILETSLADNRRRWVMDSAGEYTQVTPGDDPVCDSQSVFMQATDAAVDRGYGPGMAVNAAPTERELLVESLEDDDNGDTDNGDDDDDEGSADGDAGDRADRPASVGDGGSDHTAGVRDTGDEGEDGTAPGTESDTSLAATGDESVFDAHADRWYRPDSETYAWAVRTTDGERRYFNTREGARERLLSEYETPS